jgi:hypothetical protein
MKHKTWILLTLLLLLSACLEDVPNNFQGPDANWQPSLSFPVGYTSLQMNPTSGFDTTLLSDLDQSGMPDWVDERDIDLHYTMPFDLQKIDDKSEVIVSVLFRLNIDNGFPDKAKAQVYLLNNNYRTVDSLFVEGSIQLDAGRVIGEGPATSPTYSRHEVRLAQEQIETLGNVRYIRIEGSLLNVQPAEQLIEYYPEYKLEIQMGARVELEIDVSEQL